jgi:hypothetical protein
MTSWGLQLFAEFSLGYRRGFLEVRAGSATVFAVIADESLGSTDITPVITALLAGKTVRAGVLLAVSRNFFRHIYLPGYAGHFYKRHGSPTAQRFFLNIYS